MKYNGVSDNEFRYSLFAEVGLADDFGENIYIPFHMLIWFENCDYPATATPFKGQVYFSKQFSLADVRDYYKSKGIYTVEQVNDNTLFVDSKDGYSFSYPTSPNKAHTGDLSRFVGAEKYRLT